MTPTKVRSAAYRARKKVRDSDALVRLERYEEVLRFYADPEAWSQPPVRVAKGLFGDEYESKSSMVQRDRGGKARDVLNPSGGKP